MNGLREENKNIKISTKQIKTILLNRFNIEIEFS